MAERRMFAKTIVDSDAFLDMPIASQCLYFHLAMRADDEGFVNKAKSVARTVGAKEEDFRPLIERRFVLVFDDGVIVIKHWRIHNWIRGDRLQPTKYQQHKSTLFLDENNAYTDKCQTYVSQLSDKCHTEDRLGKDSIGKINNIGAQSSRFTPPSVEEVDEYCKGRKNNVDPAAFVDFYESKGWMVGKNKMKDWKAAVRTWERSNPKPAEPEPPKPKKQVRYREVERDGEIVLEAIADE